MGIQDLVNKAKDALGSEKGERASDRGIQVVGDGFDRLTGGRFAGHTDTAQEHGDRLLGNDADAADGQTQHDAPRH